MKHKTVFLPLVSALGLATLLWACPQPDTPAAPSGPVAVSFSSVVQTGGTSGANDSTGLTLTFDKDVTSLTADQITLTGATKGALSGSGTTRSLAISNITVANGATVTVAIANPSGFTISGSPKTAVVYKGPKVGDSYQGGYVAYIYQAGDPGYVAGETHGLIVSTVTLNSGIIWATPAKQSEALGTTLDALGEGLNNTNKIVAQNGAGLTYAAGVLDAYAGGGYTDWFLPSRNELLKLWANKALIPSLEPTGSFWSSTESSASAAHYFYFAATSPDPYTINKGVTGVGIRAMRYF